MIPSERIAGVYKAVDFTRGLLVVVLFGFIVVSMGFQIVLRTFEWTDEILRYINIWVIFLGASIAIKRSSHLQIDFFVGKALEGKRGRALARIRLLVVIAVLLILAGAGALKTIESFNVQTQMVEMSVAWFYAALPVGCLLMAMEYLLILFYGRHPFVKPAAAREESTC